jgi:RecJ-like exonuclease
MSDEPDPMLSPGDEAPPDAASAGEVQCPECGGEGRIEGETCRACDGTGRVERAVGGG